MSTVTAALVGLSHRLWLGIAWLGWGCLDHSLELLQDQGQGLEIGSSAHGHLEQLQWSQDKVAGGWQGSGSGCWGWPLEQHRVASDMHYGLWFRSRF